MKEISKKEFKSLMLRGRGRAVIALRQAEDKEKYRDLVLWACRRNMAFDPQCEGTRARYVYDMVCCYEDRGPFLEAALGRFRSCRGRSWFFEHCCELIACFASGGDPRADLALRERYADFRMELGRRKNVDPVLLEHFESLTDALLTVDPTAAARIMEDVGKLLEENSRLQWEDFFCLHCSLEETLGTRAYRKEMRRGAGPVRRYREGYEKSRADDLQREARQAAWNAERERCVRDYLDGTGELPRPVAFLRSRLQQAGPEAREAAARRVLAEPDPEKRAAQLAVFDRAQCPWPLEIQPLLAWAESPCGNLREAALWALCNVPGQEARDLAMDLAELPETLPEAVIMLAANYQPGDEPRLLDWLERLPEGGMRHEVYLDMFQRLFRKGVKNPPKQVLLYLYEHTPCGCCRREFTAEMKRRRMLTPALLEECRWDSNPEIRAMAEKSSR